MVADVLSRHELPAQFSDLEPFVEKWAVEPLSRRQQARLASTLDELKEFYDALMPRGDEAIEYLNSFNLERMPRDARLLLNLMLSLMEIAHSVELWGRVDQPDAFLFERVKIVLDL